MPFLQVSMIKRKTPSARHSKHLCAGAGYRGRRPLEVIETHGYIAHFVDRGKEAQAKRRDPTKKARRWVVGVCHSWFNHFFHKCVFRDRQKMVVAESDLL